MSKMSIADAAIKLGVSKEAIHNRIRRGSLESVIEDGVKLVILTKGRQTAHKTTSKRSTIKPLPQVDDRYYKLLEDQNASLQIKVEKLEGETKTLREQKENMLISERERIEQIYKDKDEQLKNILNAISSKFLLNAPDDESLLQTHEHVEVEIETEEEVANKLVSLKKYIKERGFSKKKAKKIRKRFEKVAAKDGRIIMVGKKYYINISRFDYTDLLA